jgi:hypothetical protein
MTTNLLPAQSQRAFGCSSIAACRESDAVSPRESPWRRPVRTRLGGEAGYDDDGRGKKRGKLDERKPFSHHRVKLS